MNKEYTEQELKEKLIKLSCEYFNLERYCNIEAFDLKERILLLIGVINALDGKVKES